MHGEAQQLLAVVGAGDYSEVASDGDAQAVDGAVDVVHISVEFVSSLRVEFWRRRDKRGVLKITGTKDDRALTRCLCGS